MLCFFCSLFYVYLIHLCSPTSSSKIKTIALHVLKLRILCTFNCTWKRTCSLRKFGSAKPASSLTIQWRFTCLNPRLDTISSWRIVLITNNNLNALSSSLYNTNKLKIVKSMQLLEATKYQVLCHANICKFTIFISAFLVHVIIRKRWSKTGKSI